MAVLWAWSREGVAGSLMAGEEKEELVATDEEEGGLSEVELGVNEGKIEENVGLLEEHVNV